MDIKKKRGQATIFIIIAIILVAAAVIVYLLFPNVLDRIRGVGEENPNLIMQNCLEETLNENLELIASQGGSLEPEFYFLYKDEKLQYLCYTAEYYKTCVVQEPILIQSVSEEISQAIKEKENECLETLKETYENQGYSVTLGAGESRVDLLPQKIEIVFDKKLTLTPRNDNPVIYDSFKVVVNNNLYELLSIANNIIEWETIYGDSETTTYMDYYRNLKVEKFKQYDGTTVYILTERDTEKKFQFASRSLAWPPVYGMDSVSTTP